ncbi:spermine synthase [Aquisalimonas sp.]|uniref:spermine/spermidine synthase domain-containing protein n=1 Tax=Aquisalimonas sp. TaxID=1872621 RepID=UPI0025C41D18|nr:spermine synthase [Aquisalimonas sp.]
MSKQSPTTPEYITRGQRVVEDLYSDYQHIIIAHDPDYGHVLYLDDDLQIAESDHAYNRAMVEPIIEAGLLDRVLILGGGDGGVLKVAVHSQVREATLVDIDGKVVELARTYLPGLCENAFDAGNARVVIGDAFAWLDGAHGYDAIIYDLTMEPVRANQSRLEFIEEIVGRIADSLKPDGMLTMQCCSEHQPGLREEIHQALTRHFTAVSDRPVDIPSYHERWIFASARYPIKEC